MVERAWVSCYRGIMDKKDFKRGDFISSVDVTFPLQHVGVTVDDPDWDIMGRWAVDADGRGFAEFGCGTCMMPTSIVEIVRELEREGCTLQAELLRPLIEPEQAILGKPRLPYYARVALQKGWTPPASFKREDYK